MGRDWDNGPTRDQSHAGRMHVGRWTKPGPLLWELECSAGAKRNPLFSEYGEMSPGKEKRLVHPTWPCNKPGERYQKREQCRAPETLNGHRLNDFQSFWLSLALRKSVPMSHRKSVRECWSLPHGRMADMAISLPTHVGTLRIGFMIYNWQPSLIKF
jgi:hypothetical protein